MAGEGKIISQATEKLSIADDDFALILDIATGKHKKVKGSLFKGGGGIVAVFTDIADRDANSSDLVVNDIVEVTDASADYNVDSGIAWYKVVDPATPSFSIISRQELMIKAIVDASIDTAASATITEDVTPNEQERGTSVQPTLTSTFDRGQIQNGDASAGPDLVGAPSQHEISGPGITGGSEVITSTNLVEAFLIDSAVELADGANTWTTVITHDAGAGAYTKSDGSPDTSLDGSRGAGTKQDTVSLFGRKAAFRAVGSNAATNSAEARALTKDLLDGSDQAVITNVMEIGDTKSQFVVPNGATVVITDLDVLGGTDITSDYVVTTITVNDAAGNPFSYDVYYLENAGYGSQHRHECDIN